MKMNGFLIHGVELCTLNHIDLKKKKKIIGPRALKFGTWM